MQTLAILDSPCVSIFECGMKGEDANSGYTGVEWNFEEPSAIFLWWWMKVWQKWEFSVSWLRLHCNLRVWTRVNTDITYFCNTVSPKIYNTNTIILWNTQCICIFDIHCHSAQEDYTTPFGGTEACVKLSWNVGISMHIWMDWCKNQFPHTFH